MLESIINRIILILILVIGQTYAVDSLEALRETFTIKDNVLITNSGEKYFRYPFESKLHFDLAYYMKDLKAADSVYNAYKKVILPVVVKLAEDGTSNTADRVFSKALTQTCLLFGNPNESPESSFLCALADQGESLWEKEFQKEVKEFIQEANKPLYVPKPTKENKFTIVLITTSASGGNYAVTESMNVFLQKCENIKTIVIDVEDIAKEVDPIMLATNTYTYDMIYSSIFQKTNDFSVIPGRKILNREIQQFIPNTLLARLKQKVAALNPDLIISTRSYTSDDIALASLGIPFRLFHPDFELCPSLNAYYKNHPPKSIKFWIPTDRASMFKPLFEDAGRLDLYDEKEDYEGVMKKLSGLFKHELKSQFELIGYPCSNFFPVKDEGQIQELRNKWKIKEGEIPVFIVMGKHSTHSMKEIFDHLIQSQSKLPLKFIVICGKNDSLKEELDQRADGRFEVYGLLSPAEMNEVMNISTFGISKAGGGTVVEAFTLNKHLLLMHSYPWEKLNAVYLKEMGLATEYVSSKPLIEQIEQVVNGLTKDNDKACQYVDWKSNLMRHLHLN